MSRTLALVLLGAAAALGIVLLRGVAAETPTAGATAVGPTAPTATPAAVTAPTAPRPSAAPPTLAAAPPATSGPLDRGALGRDPDGARRVLGLVGRQTGSREAKVAAIHAAIRATGPCAAAACATTRAALEARVDLAGQHSGGQLRLRASECFEVACVVEVETAGAAIEPFLERLQTDGQLDWPVPTLFTRPVLAEDGAQSALWVFFNPA